MMEEFTQYESYHEKSLHIQEQLLSLAEVSLAVASTPTSVQ